jgi:hypothetical protein
MQTPHGPDGGGGGEGAGATGRRPRDARLDLFRGLAMLIIFIAHVPDNSWNGFIPARFGFSNATEMFVFCSGFASALAFGSVFVRRGFLVGTARILHRCWEVYRAHIGLFLAITALYMLADARWPHVGYLVNQGLDPWLARPSEALLAMLTLRWQADYLDILPMYLVILCLVPAMMALRRVAPVAPFAAALALYAAAWAVPLGLPANPWEGRLSYFNPFAWQLIFFAGFAFGAGWFPPVRPGDRRLLIVAALYLAAALPLSFWLFTENLPALAGLREALLPSETQQTNLHPLRILHFLALAYVALSLIEPWRGRIGDGPSRHVVTVGQQSLLAFLASLLLARVAGVLLDAGGRDAVIVAAVNLGGLALLIAVAHAASRFKALRSEPSRGG